DLVDRRADHRLSIAQDGVLAELVERERELDAAELVFRAVACRLNEAVEPAQQVGIAHARDGDRPVANTLDAFKLDRVALVDPTRAGDSHPMLVLLTVFRSGDV